MSDILETSQEITDTDNNTENDEETVSTPPVLSNKNPVSILASIRDKKAVKKSVKFAEVESSSDSESREGDFSTDSVDTDVTSSSQAGFSGVRTRKQQKELRRKVLEKESIDGEKEPVEGESDMVAEVIQSADADSSSENQSEGSPDDSNTENSDTKTSDSEVDESKSDNVDITEGKTVELSEDTTDFSVSNITDETTGQSSSGITEKESEELETIVKNAEIKNLAAELLEHWSTLKVRMSNLIFVLVKYVIYRIRIYV